MITTNRTTSGICNACGLRGIIAAKNGRELMCVPCYDSAGDDNAVSDGYMTCDEFQSRWNRHSEYCAGHAPVAWNCTLTVPQIKRIFDLINVGSSDRIPEADLDILIALNTGKPVVA